MCEEMVVAYSWFQFFIPFKHKSHLEETNVNIGLDDYLLERA